MSDLASLVELRLLAWIALLAIVGAAAIVWHALLDEALTYHPAAPPVNLLAYGLVSAPARPHPQPTPLPTPPDSPAYLLRPLVFDTPEEPAMPEERSGPDGYLRSDAGVVPLALARERVRALGGLYRLAERLAMPPRAVRHLLVSERPLPPWILDELFDGAEANGEPTL